jgi:RecB family exonuclease
MAKKPSLSPSKITTYLACPVKYRWTYVDSQGKWYLRAKSYYSFGTTLHRVLELFHRSEDNGVETTQEALAAYDENWLDAGFHSAEEMAESYHEGKEMLEHHLDQVQKRQTTAKVIAVEKMLKIDTPNFVLSGRIDRLDEHEDGTVEIVDYKSGRASVTEEEVANDISMGVYQLLVREAYPDRSVIATIYALRSGESASYSMSDQEIERFRRDITLLGDEIITQEYFDLTPRLKRLCVGCDFVPLCRRQPDFAEEWEAAQIAAQL